MELPEKSLKYYCPGKWVLVDLNDCLLGNPIARDVDYKLIN